MKKIKIENLILIFVCVTCSALYISLIFNNNVWMDEAFTATLAHNSFIGVLYLSMMDTLPPLYNVILKGTTTLLGYTVPIMKLTSVIPMLLTMAIGATTVRKRFNTTTAIVFILSITGMPLMLYYGVEIRMYSLGFFFATASGIYAYEVICNSCRKNWILFTAFSVLAGYSHHFAFVTVGFVYLFLLLYYFFADRTHIIRWFKCLGATFAVYLPCMVVTLKQLSNVSGYFSMPDVTLRLFIQYATYPYMVGVLIASLLCIGLVGLLLLLCAYKYIRNMDRSKDSIYSVCCFVIYYGVLIFGTIVSKIMTANIFVDRYLFFSTGLLWLFVAIQIGKLPRKFQYIIGIVVIFITICSYKVEYSIEYSNSADEEIEFLAENVHKGDIFFGLGGHEEMDNCIPFLSILANNDAPLTYVYPLDNALQTASQNQDITLWISVLDGFEPTADDYLLLNQYGYELEKASDFDFDRYKCVLYRAVPVSR